MRTYIGAAIGFFLTMFLFWYGGLNFMVRSVDNALALFACFGMAAAGGSFGSVWEICSKGRA